MTVDNGFNIDDFKKILGEDIPDGLGITNKMINSISPLLAKINHHRDEILKQPGGSELLKPYDEQMRKVKEAKDQLKKFK